MSVSSAGKTAIKFLVLVVTAVLTACGGGGGGSSSTSVIATPTATAPPISKAEAFRFLNQATFGATEAEANRLIALGDSNNAYSRWIDQQIGREASLLLPAVEAAYPDPIPANFNIAVLNNNRLEQWFSNALRGEDQLRQRVAFALSEIFVVSQVGALLNLPNATADFHDMLARDHGTTTILPKCPRLSMRSKAERISSSGTCVSTSGLRRPSWHICMTVSYSPFV